MRRIRVISKINQAGDISHELSAKDGLLDKYFRVPDIDPDSDLNSEQQAFTRLTELNHSALLRDYSCRQGNYTIIRTEKLVSNH